MKKKTVVMGVNVGHDGGSAIVIDGQITCSISEERLNRRRYSSGYVESFIYCLKQSSLSIDDIDLVVFSSYGQKLPEGYQGMLQPLGLPRHKFYAVDHHLSHAYGAYFLSPFEDALIIVIDGQGNQHDTESYYVGERQTITKIGANDPQRSVAKGLGRTYEAFTNFLGWIDQEAGKTMGLSSYSESSQIRVPLFEIRGDQVIGALEYPYEKGVMDFCNRHDIDFGEPFMKGVTDQSKLAAAYVQHQTEEALLTLITNLINKTGKKNLCLAGGVALNCNANAKILERGLVEHLFVLPASSDRGQPMGNALWGYHHLTGEIPRNPLVADYFGRSYTHQEMESALARRSGTNIKKTVPRVDIEFSQPKNLEKEVAQLIWNDKIVAWFQGGSELGPRALGHRSILANPTSPRTKELLNSRIKHRESFRPYAPSCLEEHSRDYFEYSGSSSPFMLLTLPVKKEMSHKIPSVTHVDNTARVQTVTREANGNYYNLIKEFFRLSNVPMVLNTSFNDQEPIVESPSDAVSTFISTDIDFLVLGPYLASKRKI